MKMIKNLRLLASLLAAALLSACDEAAYVETVAPIDRPEVYDFEVVDSYNNSNLTTHHYDLAVNPTIDNGYFDIYWDVESFNSYSTRLFINDAPSVYGALELDYNECSSRNSCRGNGYGLAYCTYDRNDYLSCSTQQQQNSSVDIYPLINIHPERLYLVLEVCDLYSQACEVHSQSVLFE
ncbi:MAG: hypothetical protein U5M23_06875 [Marinagarivorans sp.]|nr:hypothetical protein [Marinagarivorans sp.]